LNTGLLKFTIYGSSLFLIFSSATLLFINGFFPSIGAAPREVPAAFSVSPLTRALSAVDARGFIRSSIVKANRKELDDFARSLAHFSPETAPEFFQNSDERTSFWLNAYHAMVLLELRDVRSEQATLSPFFFTLPIGRKRMTRYAIERRFLSATGDARLIFALFDGSTQSGVLDGAPYDAQVLNAQLNDAARRFMRKKTSVSLTENTVSLSPLFKAHEDELLQSLPPERRHLLQIVWAYLPDACEDGTSPCLTRAALDAACGNTFAKCSIQWQPAEHHLALAD
jgi:hypothetical protein